MVPVAGPLAGPRRADDRGRGRRVRRGPALTLRATLAAEGGLLAAALGPAEDATPLAPRMFALEAVREGWHLHGGGRPRVVTRADPDLALLAGDRLYALGLERLAAAGDVDAVAVLARTIIACARAAAEGDPERARAAWASAARDMAHGG